MKSRRARKILAMLLAFAMVVTGASASMVAGQVADAAKKAKVTLKLKKKSVTLKKGKKTTLKITKKNVKKIKSQKWTTSNKKVATVSKKGKVTAKKAGNATIKVKVKYIAKGSKKTKSKTLSCKVKVSASQPAATTKPTVKPNPTAPTATTRPAASYKNYDDKSNIGPEREVTIKGGTSSKMTIKDNGTMRKELSATDLADWYMGLGINLGNTMEAQLPSLAQKAEATEATQFETAWGAALTTQKYIDCVHSYGINTLRIPVAWSNMINEETYEINDKYLGRVEEIVNYALNNGMYAIINIHWDNQWWGQFGAVKRASETDMTRVADEEKRAKAWARFESYWKQISERFKDYSDHLIFEGANEELGGRLNDPIYASGYSNPLDESDTDAIRGILKKDELYDTVNKINQKFVDIVRASGGNNKYRHLLIPGYDTNIANTVDARYKMPTDIAENGKSKLFVSVHCYSPWDFCGDGGTGGYTEADHTALAKELGMMKRFVDEGYATILGECGICNPSGVDGDVCQWFRDCFSEARKLHMVPVMWETGQYFNRSEAKLKFKDVAETWNDITGAKGDTSMTRLTGKKNAPPLEISEIAKEEKPAWSWTGKWYKNGGDSIVGDDRYTEGGGTKVESTDPDHASKFVPSSQVTPTIDGDSTEISFNEWGYQTFLKIDLSKYKKPAIAFEFLDGTANEENVGSLQIGATEEAGKYVNDFAVDYWDLNGKAVTISDNIGLSDEKPWLSITFSGKPTVTAIHVYELGE